MSAWRSKASGPPSRAPRWARSRELLAQADAALARRNRLDALGANEQQYLAPLIEAASRDLSLGDVVLGDWSPSQPDALASLLRRAEY